MIARIIILILLLLPSVGFAQNSLSLSVTPPLFQISAEPEQSWQSYIKIINSNSFDITVYANPVNFTPIGEAGQGRFLPVLETETEGQTLAEWISVTREPIVVKKGQSYNLPFSVNVPENPSPGGHFAAVLIGTKPPEGADATAVHTSQMVSSLMFLSIAGDVLEQGRIREFSSQKTFVEQPEADFTLRFENSGNVHIRPQGDIVIYNMWGKRRGEVPINQTSTFGNVLPQSIRKFDFSWKGETSITDIGRYKAVVTLAYGSGPRQNLSQSTYFWVIPVKATAITLLSIFTLIFLIRRAINSYVRRMLINAGIDPEEHGRHKARGDVAMYKRVAKRVVEDEDEGFEETGTESGNILTNVFSRYWHFIIGVPAAILLLGMLFWYLSSSLQDEKGFEASIETAGTTETVSSESLRLEEIKKEKSKSEAEVTKQEFDLEIINATDEPGVAADIASVLSDNGYVVTNIDPGLDEEKKKRTVIVSHPDLVDEATSLSAILLGALVSFVEPAVASSTPKISVFLGTDALE